MTDQIVYEYRAYEIINPTQSSITRSINGEKSPYRSPYEEYSDANSRRQYHFDTSKRQWLLVYKRQVGTTFQEPSGDTVHKILRNHPIASKHSEYLAKTYIRGNSLDQKSDLWNKLEIDNACKSILNDVIFNDTSHRGPLNRFHTERILNHLIEIAQENDITALHYGAYWTWYYGGLTNEQKQTIYTKSTYGEIDRRCKLITQQYPWLNATTWESEHGSSSDSGGASGQSRNAEFSMIDNPDYVKEFGIT